MLATIDVGESQNVGRCGDLMVSYSGLNGFGSCPGREHCIVFLGRTLNSHSASLHPGVQISTNRSNAGDNPAMD